MTTIAEALDQASAVIAGDSPRLDAEVLLAHCLDKPRGHLLAWPEKPLPPDTERRFLALVNKRASGRPISHLTGQREFWSLPLRVTPDVLIPRPETELLVETALARLASPRARVADLGAGSGAIALALASERPGWRITATDQSAAALTLARQNAERLGLNAIEFRQGDWCDALAGEPYDLILSNPPYIPPGDPHLQTGDLRFEPRQALVSADDGLADLAAIIDQARAHLKPGGWLMLEHGYNQAEPVRKRLARRDYQAIETLSDLAGHPRVTVGACPETQTRALEQ